MIKQPNFEILGNILIKAIVKNIEIKTEPFYFKNTNQIDLKTLKILAIYAILQFLIIKNPRLKLEEFEEFKDYNQALEILKNTKLQGYQFLNVSKYASIKKQQYLFNTKCYKKLTITQQMQQRQITHKTELSR
jgi:hypothetical protein